jgi:AraC family transcriptional regulator
MKGKTNPMQAPTVTEYRARINRTMDYIDQHITESFTLDRLAGIAGFSKFHFNRIFRAMVGETPFQYITRVRLSRAATMLVMSPGETISEIAFANGFSDIAIFSRNFKSFTGVSATEYRRSKGSISNFSQKLSNLDQPLPAVTSYFCAITNQIKWRTTMETNKSIDITKFEKMTVAYLRHVGPYAGDEKLFERLWNQLFTWAGPRGLIGGPAFRSLVIYHDDPNITEADKLRMSVCITVPPDTKVDGEIGRMELEGGDYVVARFEVDASQFGEAWNWLYGVWFPQSGYQPDDKPCFEMYPEEPRDGKFVVDICVPVKPL